MWADPPLLMGDGVLERLPVRDIVAAVRASLTQALVSPPRVTAPLPAGGVIFTVGLHLAPAREIAGFRAYLDPEPGPDADQITAVWDAVSGRVRAMYVGRELGEWRTGALGAVAISRLARSDAGVLGVIGTGRQAWTQALGAAAVRRFRRVLVHSRSAANRAAFAERLASRTGLAVEETGSAERTAAESDVLITATDSPRPVIRAEWVRPGAHVNHVGPKRAGASELPPALYDGAGLLATDAPAQLQALGGRSVLWGRSCLARVLPLAELPEDAHARRGAGPSIYHSLGLAGTEVVLAHWLWEQLRSARPTSDGGPVHSFPHPTETPP